MVTDFMRDHIRLREISRRVEPPAHLFIERQIDVNLLIARTVEWANGSAGHPTRRAHLIGKENQRWLSILPTVLTKHVLPDVFRFREDHGNKLLQLVFLRIGWTRALHTRR